MPLSKEAFAKLRSQGLSIKQIVAFEKGNVPKRDPDTIAKPIGTPAKIFEAGERALNVLSDPATKKIYGPLARKLSISPQARAKIQALEGQKNVAYPSDILEELVPQLKANTIASDIPFMLPMGGMIQGAPRIIAKTAVDVALDPLSFLTFFQKSPLGALVRTVHEAKQASQSIKLSSKVAKQIAKEMGVATPSAKVIKDFIKKYPKPAGNITQEMLRKEKSLISANLPFTDANIPLLTGKPAAVLTQPFSALAKTKQVNFIENAVRDVFSTKSGNEDFDLLIGKARDIVHYKTGIEVDEGKTFNKKLDDLSREMGIPRDELNNKLTAIGELATKPTKAQVKAKYNKNVYDILENTYHGKVIDSQVKFKNTETAYKKAFALGDDDLAVKLRTDMDKHSKDIVDYQSELNKLQGKYAPPPSMNPKEAAIVKEIKAKYANALFKNQVSGVKALPLLADGEYVPHITTLEAAEAARNLLKEEGKFPSKLSQKEFNTELTNSFRRQFNEIKPIVIKAWQKSGLITNREAKAILSKNPLTVVTTDKFGNKFKNKLPSGMDMLDNLLEKGKITEAQFTDAAHWLTVNDVNELSRQGKLSNMFGDYTGEVFHTDPVFTSTVRGVKGEVANTAAEFYQQMTKRGLAIPDAKAPPDWVNVKQAELEGFKVEPRIARVLNKLNEFNSNPEEWNKFFSFYDKAHRYQKIITLAPFPAYHTMNAIGNLWNNFLAGVVNPDVYRQAEQARLGGKVEFKDVFNNQWNSKKLVEEGKKLGVIGSGQYGGEIQHTIKETLNQAKLRGTDFITPSSRNRFLRAGLWVGKRVEDNARMAHFIDRLRKGDTAEQAAQSVKKFLFDYGDLTNIEKKAFNRIFFFYTWTRKNLPLQLQGLVTTPGKYSLPYKARHEIEKETEQPKEKYLYEYMKDNFPVRVRIDSKTKQPQYFMLNRWLPAADLVKAANLHDIALQSLSPIPKEVLQQIWNYDFYFKKEIQKYPGETTKFLGKDIPVRYVHGAKIIRMLNEIDKMTKSDSDLMTKMIGLLTGKLQTFDETQGMLMNKSRVDADMKVLNSAIFKESQKAPMNEKQIERILELINKKAEEY